MTQKNFNQFAHELNENAIVIYFNEGRMEIVYAEAGLDESIISEVQAGTLIYGLYSRDAMPVLLLGAGRFKVDCWINSFDLLAGKPRGTISSYQGAVRFSIVTPKDFILVAQRDFYFEQKFLLLLKQSFYDQRREYRDRHDVISKLPALTSSISTDDMFDSVKQYAVERQQLIA